MLRRPPRQPGGGEQGKRHRHRSKQQRKPHNAHACPRSRASTAATIWIPVAVETQPGLPENCPGPRRIRKRSKASFNFPRHG
ncbi:hypothetical protein BG36_05895 [Aquamicrobium defluvii]|uniref:Uncharacterized protein n=1 Tax=Aquamicrobium defluvii TaxID=69279 RepID=A0A011T4R4_9HYPH|nr:hypothetical protein BG36_05895 [Aquamicrobium defluvii]EZQ14412.1 hypothetical protein CF98_19435 [Halopseudomonas bauzanensis]